MLRLRQTIDDDVVVALYPFPNQRQVRPEKYQWLCVLHHRYYQSHQGWNRSSLRSSDEHHHGGWQGPLWGLPRNRLGVSIRILLEFQPSGRSKFMWPSADLELDHRRGEHTFWKRVQRRSTRWKLCVFSDTGTSLYVKWHVIDCWHAGMGPDKMKVDRATSALGVDWAGGNGGGRRKCSTASHGKVGGQYNFSVMHSVLRMYDAGICKDRRW